MIPKKRKNCVISLLILIRKESDKFDSLLEKVGIAIVFCTGN